MAEIELSILSKQSLADRIGDRANLVRQVNAWVKQRNEKKSDMQWRFTTADARIRLRHLYPSV